MMTFAFPDHTVLSFSKQKNAAYETETISDRIPIKFNAIAKGEQLWVMSLVQVRICAQQAEQGNDPLTGTCIQINVNKLC